MDNRKARILDRALKEGKPNSEDVDQSPDVESLYHLAEALKGAPEVNPSPMFRQSARSRLLAKLPDQQPVTFIDRLRLQWQTFTPLHKRRAAMTWLVVIATLITVLAGGGGVAYASTDSLPGDALYPVKMTIEDVQFQFANEEAILVCI